MISSVVSFLKNDREYGNMNMSILIFGPYIIALILIFFGNFANTYANISEISFKGIISYTLILIFIGYIIIPIIVLSKVFGSIKYGALSIYKEIDTYDFKSNKQLTLVIVLGLGQFIAYTTIAFAILLSIFKLIDIDPYSMNGFFHVLLSIVILSYMVEAFVIIITELLNYNGDNIIKK